MYSIHNIYRMYITCFKPKFLLIVFRYFPATFLATIFKMIFLKKVHQLTSGHLPVQSQ